MYISKRFETANGRVVELVPCESNVWSYGPSQIPDERSHHKFWFRLDDGRSLCLALTEDELQKLVERAADGVERTKKGGQR